MNIREGLASVSFDVDIEDDEIVTDAIILARITRMSDGRKAMVMARSEGSDIVVTTGLIHCGVELHQAGEWLPVEDED